MDALVIKGKDVYTKYEILTCYKSTYLKIIIIFERTCNILIENYIY